MPRLSKIGAAALAAFGWTGISTVSASYLVVAGGGAGGPYDGGGGGAGGYQTGTVSLNPTLSYTVTIGAGGAGQTSNTVATGNNGSNSQFGTLTASVGGGGGGSTGGGGSQNGAAGGSGGGGSYYNKSGGAGTVGQGNNGGVSTGFAFGGGGGGGAGAVGGAAVSSTQGGAGGVGLSSSISGTSTFYAGGGGGGADPGTTTQALGGNGGGGNSAFSRGNNGTAGTANTGGGGGGGVEVAQTGYSGGSGIVIISYAGAQQFSGGVVTSVGGNTIHTFTTSGTLGPITTLSASYLIVAGGGGGGTNQGGGGGAGGLLSGSGLTLDSNSIYTVTVGGGGATATNGSSSAFSMVSTTSVGGGAGGGNVTNGSAGGSGGGGGGSGPGSTTGGAGTAGQGFAGGVNLGNMPGGAGGAGGVGGNATLLVGGIGGVGVASSISGASTYYAGGGGGGNAQNVGTGGSGGNGGGGAGGTNANGTAGTANLGGGGGGGGNDSAVAFTGAAGGSGVVIISYAGAAQLMAGGVVTIVGGNVIHTFNSSGFLTPLTLFTRSLRFRSSASAYLNRTQGAGNRKIFTLSAWVKRGSLGSYNPLFTGQNDSANSDWDTLEFNSSDVLRFYLNGAASGYFVTTQVFRDPAAWYHLVLAVDTTQATSTNRVKIYVNGSQITSFTTATYPSQNFDCWINKSGRVAALGANYYSAPTGYFDGYLAEVNFIDGQALAPTSFGTINSYGVWQPITYGGSYGTNGFYLPFTNNASTTTLGYDFSPQGNNWTTNNISLTAGATYDSMTDVPTLTSATAANYCVLNPLDKGGGASATNGNLTLVDASPGSIRSTIGMTTGKFYAEFTMLNTSGTVGISIGGTSLSAYTGFNANEWSYGQNGQKITGGVGSAYGATFTTSDVIAVAFDADAGTLTFYKNNASQGVAFTGLTSGPYFFTCGDNAATSQNVNFGQRPFAYTPPSGFVALNTFNL